MKNFEKKFRLKSYSYNRMRDVRYKFNKAMDDFDMENDDGEMFYVKIN